MDAANLKARYNAGSPVRRLPVEPASAVNGSAPTRTREPCLGCRHGGPQQLADTVLWHFLFEKPSSRLRHNGGRRLDSDISERLKNFQLKGPVHVRLANHEAFWNSARDTVPSKSCSSRLVPKSKLATTACCHVHYLQAAHRFCSESRPCQSCATGARAVHPAASALSHAQTVEGEPEIFQ